MAFAADSFSINRMASLVGTLTNSMWRRSASRSTSFITGKRPYAPVPITSRWHFQGIFSSVDRGRMPKLVTELLGGCLLAFADFSAVDHYILLVGEAVDSEGAEGQFIEVHAHLHVLLCLGALPRSDGREGRPALFYLAATTMRAGGLFRVMLCDGENLREGFFAGVANELIVGHIHLPRSLDDYG
jgi:hypothetical protein